MFRRRAVSTDTISFSSGVLTHMSSRLLTARLCTFKRVHGQVATALPRVHMHMSFAGFSVVRRELPYLHTITEWLHTSLAHLLKSVRCLHCSCPLHILGVINTIATTENGDERTFASAFCNQHPSSACSVLGYVDRLLSYTTSTCTCTGPVMACHLANVAQVHTLQQIVRQERC
jgi:hypothetical protein